jgi:hypothetical protein
MPAAVVLAIILAGCGNSGLESEITVRRINIVDGPAR